jgi:uroporphyrinogen decarboxylase
MDHKQRIQNCLSGLPVDRPPVSLWRHFPVEDQEVNLLAKAIINFQNAYDFDFVKITPASSFCIKDWGVKDTWKGNPEGTREITEYPIKFPEDWAKIKPLAVKNNGLSAQWECAKLIRNNLPPSTPVIQTIFNPLSQAKNLVGKSNLLIHLRLYPEQVKIALQVITETTINFIESLASLGIDGMFYAVQHAQAGLLSRSEFEEFSKTYDLEILDHFKKYWLNVLHIHGDNIYFDQVMNYPCQVINWHDQETPPDLSSAQTIFNGAVCGGLRQWDTLVNGNPGIVREEANKAINATKGQKFILGTGCVLPITAPHSNILAARQAVEKATS